MNKSIKRFNGDDAMKPTWKIWFIAILIVLGIGASIIAYNVATATTPALPPATMIYLAPSSLPPAEDIPGSSAALHAEGVTVVNDLNSLKRVAEKVKPDVIMLHRASLPGVDKSWLRTQYSKGIIIAAINVKMREMADLVSDPSILESPWADNWYKKPFYSYVGIRERPLSGTRVHGTNNINDTERNLQSFVFALKLAVNTFRSKP